MPTSAWNKFQDYAEQVNKGVHNWATHTFKLALTNTAPVATQTTFDAVTNHPPPAAVNGYTALGYTITVTTSEVTGTMTVSGAQVVPTAAGGNLGPFRYAVIYNDSATSPADALVAWLDYGSALTLADGEVLTIKFNNATPGSMFTLV